MPDQPIQGPKVLLVTGMSGAGRSTAGKVLEDIGYVVVDNLPLSLIDNVAHLHDVEEGETRLAVTVDVRTGVQIGPLRETLSQTLHPGSALSLARRRRADAR